ncbi:MAG TPA: hypothetical protein VD813_02320, partial [Pseudonocardia sp.]|nr:hypothetical protein [Pseudonocardia sp.]
HAIWSREVFGAGNRDQLRLYLAATSPDVRRRDFTATGYAAFVQDVLREWEHWIAGVGARVGEHFAGTAPEAGPWNADAERGYGHIRDLLAAAGSAYRPDRLGLRHAVAAMRTFVDRMSEFAEVVEDVLAGGPGSPIARTVVALELMAVRTLAAAAAPLAPDLAARLASAVGEPGGVPATDVPGWVRPGTPVSFGSGFFTEDALRSVRLPSES